MEPGEVIWEGKIGPTLLRVGVPHAESIIAEWETPRGPRHKVTDSMEEFERAVLFQLLLGAGETDESVTQEVKAAVAKAQAERPRRTPEAEGTRRRKNPKVRQHRRSRRPPRRR
ncbi:MAG TPA: hypothetical protein VNC78_05905 [Actinomycetota bacterium]|nr:hypothetical protein [Actinomycetota bacterium]